MTDRTRRPTAYESGFSLLEVLIAVALMASAVGIVGIAIGPLIERSERAAETRLVETFVRDARFTALAERRTVSLGGHTQTFLGRVDVDPFSVEADIHAYPNGRCSSGPLRVRTAKRVRDFIMEEDQCIIVPQG